uniref:RING-type E3 ubiquitin transferase n=1 Tax=Leersia perrieri TaxID=77586 RepID=A0A0D9XVN9_9ORYZ
MSLPGVSSSTYKSPVFIGLIAVMSVAALLLLHHCLLVTFCHSRRRRRRLLFLRQQHTHHQQQHDDDDDSSVDMATSSPSSSSSTAKLVVVVCPYRKAPEEEWGEAMCPVCLSEFADGEPVRVLPDCLHYFHVDCIGMWLRSNTSCPLCRADATPTPSSGDHHHHLSSVSVSLEEILVRT